MTKLFDIPVYALTEKTLVQRADAKIKTVEKNAPGTNRETLNRLIERETFPMRNWDYNHIIGYIQIGLTKQDIVASVFMPVPAPARYRWDSVKRHFVQDLGANNAHRYIGNMKVNEDIQTVARELLECVIRDHLNRRFHVDRTAFDAVNSYIDYLYLLQKL